MGQVSNALKLWKRAFQQVRVAPTMEERTTARERLRVAFEQLTETVLGDDKKWDEDDHRAWKYLKELDEGDEP